MSECSHGVPRFYRCSCDCPHPHPADCPHEHVCDDGPIPMDSFDAHERRLVLALLAAKKAADEREDPKWQLERLKAGTKTLRAVRRELRDRGASRLQSAASPPGLTSQT